MEERSAIEKRSSRSPNSIMNCIKEVVLVRSELGKVLRGFSIGQLKTS